MGYIVIFNTLGENPIMHVDEDDKLSIFESDHDAGEAGEEMLHQEGFDDFGIFEQVYQSKP